MQLNDQFGDARKLFLNLTFYERFEHAVVLVATVLIVVIVASAT